MAQLRNGRQRRGLVHLQHLQQTAARAQQGKAELLGNTSTYWGVNRKERPEQALGIEPSRQSDGVQGLYTLVLSGEKEMLGSSG